jgi:hypothetical protein
MTFPDPPVEDWVNIEPSDEGYANIAITFLQSTLQYDVFAHRQQAVRELVGQALTIVAYLVQRDRPDLAKRVIDSLEV